MNLTDITKLLQELIRDSSQPFKYRVKLIQDISFEDEDGDTWVIDDKDEMVEFYDAVSKGEVEPVDIRFNFDLGAIASMVFKISVCSASILRFDAGDHTAGLLSPPQE